MQSSSLTGPRAGAKPSVARRLVVFLHGYGADGHDLIGLSEVFGSALPETAFVAPDGPEVCAVNPGGRQWFPIPSFDGTSESAMARSFEATVSKLHKFLDEEAVRYSFSVDQIALVGFSQGTMMSLHVGLRRDEAVAGIIGFSGRLLVPERLAADIRVRPEVLLVHGDADEMIPVEAIHEARAALAEAEVPVRWHISAGMGHGIAPDGIALGREFLRDRFQ